MEGTLPSEVEEGPSALPPRALVLVSTPLCVPELLSEDHSPSVWDPEAHSLASDRHTGSVVARLETSCRLHTKVSSLGNPVSARCTASGEVEVVFLSQTPLGGACWEGNPLACQTRPATPSPCGLVVAA